MSLMLLMIARPQGNVEGEAGNFGFNQHTLSFGRGEPVKCGPRCWLSRIGTDGTEAFAGTAAGCERQQRSLPRPPFSPSRDRDVGPGPTVQDVAASPADEDVVARSSKERVAADAAEEHVVAVAAVRREVDRAGRQGPSVHHVPTGS